MNLVVLIMRRFFLLAFVLRLSLYVLPRRDGHQEQAFIFTVFRCIFYSEIGIGISANSTLFFHTLVFLLQCRSRSTDLAIGHLAIIQTIMLLTVGIVFTRNSESLDGWYDFSFEIALYMHRVTRRLSIFTTCQLSVLQAIILSPRSFCLAKFKPKSSQVLYSFAFLWVFNILPTPVIISIVPLSNQSKTDTGIVTDSCSLPPLSYVIQHLFASLVTFLDVCLVLLMVLASGYMVALLCRHRKQTQHLRSASLSPRASPEVSATQTILLLMGFFVTVYFLDAVLSSFSFGMVWNNSPIISSFQKLVSYVYASFSPLILICSDKRIVIFLKSTCRKCRKCANIQ